MSLKAFMSCVASSQHQIPSHKPMAEVLTWMGSWQATFSSSDATLRQPPPSTPASSPPTMVAPVIIETRPQQLSHLSNLGDEERDAWAQEPALAQDRNVPTLEWETFKAMLPFADAPKEQRDIMAATVRDALARRYPPQTGG